jgi:hypothetical protein
MVHSFKRAFVSSHITKWGSPCRLGGKCTFCLRMGLQTVPGLMVQFGTLKPQVQYSTRAYGSIRNSETTRRPAHNTKFTVHDVTVGKKESLMLFQNNCSNLLNKHFSGDFRDSSWKYGKLLKSGGGEGVWVEARFSGTFCDEFQKLLCVKCESKRFAPHKKTRNFSFRYAFLRISSFTQNWHQIREIQIISPSKNPLKFVEIIQKRVATRKSIEIRASCGGLPWKLIDHDWSVDRFTQLWSRNLQKINKE